MARNIAQTFDNFVPTAPFTMMAVLNAMPLAAALAVRRATPACTSPPVNH
ncbi:MAG: hypothetical protein Q8N51_17295 [Gammaproteobacteria bacterium]|nr:hypothetical protein [Gammaproteobacteria bacterium]